MFCKRFVLAILVCAAFISNVQAQTPEPAGKRAAIQELLNLMGATQSARAIFVSLIDQYSQALARDSISGFEKKNWPPASKQKAKQLAQDFYSRLAQRLREEVPQRVQYEAKVGRLYLDEYDQYFTEDEIRDLIVFYQSPLGQKFLGFGPKVSSTLQQKVGAELESQTLSVTQEIVAEELKKLESRAAAELRTPTPRRKG